MRVIINSSAGSFQLPRQCYSILQRKNIHFFLEQNVIRTDRDIISKIEKENLFRTETGFLKIVLIPDEMKNHFVIHENGGRENIILLWDKKISVLVDKFICKEIDIQKFINKVVKLKNLRERYGEDIY